MRTANHHAPADTRRRPRRRPRLRRGVTGVLSMMFLVMFGSLAVAMAVVSQGNLRTAETHLRVSRALGAVDTGMEIAAARLREAASRCIVARGEITADYAQDLWDGSYPTDPPVNFLDRPGSSGLDSLSAIIQALHDADASSNQPADITVPTAPAGWVVGDPIGLAKNGEDRILTAVQISYAPPSADPLAEGRVRVVVTGYDWDWSRNAYVTRSAQQMFDITKTLKHAIISPSRVMIGRNVAVDGPLGVRYDSNALDEIDGSPLTMRSDFYGLNPTLDAKLDEFYTAVASEDVDGDNRLRIFHAQEGVALDPLNLMDFSSINPDDDDPAADYAFQDVTGDNIVDDFDIFIQHYDQDGDNRLVLSPNLTQGTPNQGETPEFTDDDALAMLIDAGAPDRNDNGVSNGVFDPNDPAADTDGWVYNTFRDNNADGTIDEFDVDQDDVTLGYRDGALDRRDRYAKVRGPLTFRAARADWEAADDTDGNPISDYQTVVEGPIDAGEDQPVSFDATDDELPPISGDSFADATQALIDIADAGTSFDAQVAAQTASGWSPPVTVESTPFGSPSPADWYERPVYENMTFKNVSIPMGTNALFVNCTFVGVTRVEAYTDNTHPSWDFYGQQQRDTVTGALELVYPPPPASSDAQLDKSYSTPGAPGYDTLPDPLIVPIDVDGDAAAPDQVYDTKLLANNIRFHDCLFVGSVVADKPTVFRNVRNKLQFTGATRFDQQHPTAPNDPALNPDSDDMEEISKSSMMLPNYSVDIGTNNSPQEQDVNLYGAVIAGVLDVRGNARIEGVLLTTFEPTYGQAPLSLYGEAVGDPGDYNITLGYFGPDDGDQEGIDLSALSDLDGDGNEDIGWDSARDASGNLIEIAGWSGVHEDWWYDGVPDTDADIAPGTYVRRAIPFNGYGKVELIWDPDLVLPDGLATPLTIEPDRSTYLERKATYN